MDIHDLEKSTPAAPNRYAIGTMIDPIYDPSTTIRSTGGRIDSSSKECVLEQPDPGHSDMLRTTKTKQVRSLDGKFHCNLCPSKFLRAHNLKSHQVAHRGAFARERREALHSSEKKLICRGELSAQPARSWGCGRHFENAAALAFHFNSPGNVGKACIIPLLDKAVDKTGVFNFPPVLLTQYPKLKEFKLVQISAWQNAPTRGNSDLSPNDSGHAVRKIAPTWGSPNDSGYESTLHADTPENLFILPVQGEARTEATQKALPYHSFLSSLKSQVKPSPQCMDLQDPTYNLTLVPDELETSEDFHNSLVETIPSGDEFSRGIELLDHQIDSQGTSDSETRSSYEWRLVSKETTFAQKRAWQKDGNGHLLDDPEESLPPDESFSDSGTENGYHDTSEGSILNRSQKALISRLMDEICSSFFYQVSCRPQQRGQGGQGSRESSSSSTEQTITTNRFIRESPGSRRKRSHREDEDPEDGDDGTHKRPRNQTSDDGHSTRVRYFACPFHKFDASTYSSGNADPRVGLKYRSCGPPGWPNIGKLKEHLYRNHQDPIHCPRCWTILKTEAALGEHARASNQCDVLPPPLRWIPREVYEKLKNRKKAFAGQTEEDTWRYIFGLLFPDCPNVPSPYYNDGITLEGTTQRSSPTSNAIAAYEEYARAHLPRIFEEALETAVAEQTQPIEEGLRRSLAGMVRDCQTRLAQNFLQHRSSNMSSIGGAGAQAEALPSFYIEPLSLAEDIVSINPTQISNNGRDRSQTYSDSGYASVDTSLNRNSSELSADLSLQNNIGSLHDSTNHGIDINGGLDFMSGSSDWAALTENYQENSFFKDGLCDESI